MAEYRTMKLTAKLWGSTAEFYYKIQLWTMTQVAPKHQVLPLNSSSFEPDIVAVTTS